MSVLDQLSRRCIIVTGKGGVGKSTLTAALGRAYAAKGKRVLVAEIVPTADTPSAIQVALGGTPPAEEPQLVAERLWAALLTPTIGHHRFLQDALPLKVLADTAMRSQGLRKFLMASPGLSDMGVMYRMLDLMKRTYTAGAPLYEVCIIDSPATGHALALAQIPEFVTRIVPGGPMLKAAHDGLKVLTDPAITGVVIVTLPETLPVTEALELEKGMGRHRLPVSAIVVNRVPADPFSAEERAAIEASVPLTVFGTREMRRIERAKSALAHLRAQRPDMVVLSEVPGSGTTATGHLIAQLG